MDKKDYMPHHYAYKIPYDFQSYNNALILDNTEKQLGKKKIKLTFSQEANSKLTIFLNQNFQA